MLMMMKDK